MSEPAENLETTTDDVTTTETTTEKTTDNQEQFKWPDGWREKLAGGDEKLIKQLNEFQDPSGIFKSYRANLSKISSGEYKRALPENPSEDDLKAYRKSHGIPEKPEEYKLDDSKLEEDQKVFAQKLGAQAHALNLPPQTAQKVLDFMIENRTQALDALAENDAKDAQDYEDTLRNEWGNDYRVNKNIMSSLLDGQSPEFKEGFLNARLPDGTLFSHSPEVSKFLVDMARQINPIAAIMPQGASDPKTIDARIAELRAIKNTNPKKYYGKEVQEELVQLTGQRDKLKAG